MVYIDREPPPLVLASLIRFNVPFVIVVMLLRFQGRKDGMLWLWSIQRNYELWWEERFRVSVM